MNFDNDVPLPPVPASKIAVLKSMKIGESFPVPQGEESKWRTAMSKASERGECYFISRTMPDRSVRIWRKA